MTPERWEEVKKMVTDQFAVDEKYNEDREPGTAECWEFSTPAGKFKLCFVVRPKILDKKTSYSHRPGAETVVNYVYSDDESTSHLEVFRWDAGQCDWIEEKTSLFSY